MKETDPNWKLPRGVEQRNTALRWIRLVLVDYLIKFMFDKDAKCCCWKRRNNAFSLFRTNFATLQKGVVYFGDDDNTYDWNLFDEMRTIQRIGVWPVGIVGGLLAETPILFDNCI